MASASVELAADIAVADDAERFATDLEGAVGRFVPAAVMGRARAVGNPAQQHHDLADGQLGDAAGVGERRVEHRDALLACRFQIDLVGADREAADSEEPVSGGEDLRRELGARADAEDVHALDLLDQRGAVERLRQALQIAVAGLLHQRDGGIVDTFQQQDLDAVLGKERRSLAVVMGIALVGERLL